MIKGSSLLLSTIVSLTVGPHRLSNGPTRRSADSIAARGIVLEPANERYVRYSSDIVRRNARNQSPTNTVIPIQQAAKSKVSIDWILTRNTSDNDVKLPRIMPKPTYPPREARNSTAFDDRSSNIGAYRQRHGLPLPRSANPVPDRGTADRSIKAPISVARPINILAADAVDAACRAVSEFRYRVLSASAQRCKRSWGASRYGPPLAGLSRARKCDESM